MNFTVSLKALMIFCTSDFSESLLALMVTMTGFAVVLLQDGEAGAGDCRVERVRRSS